MRQTCVNLWCSNSYEILPEDQALLKQFDVPEPKQCPLCRHLHRGMFKETVNFYHRKSDLSGEPLLSVFHADTPFPVYSIEEWWSEKWDSKDFAREFDFDQEFFPQYIELYNAIPKMANFNENCENCTYCSSAGSAKDCYYCERAHRSESMYYCEAVTGYNNDCCDCLKCQRSEDLYECVQCVSCNNSSFLFRCRNTYDSHFSIDLDGCSNCLFCSNLRNQSYMIENKNVTKEEYNRVYDEVMNGNFSTQKKNRSRYENVWTNAIWKAVSNVNCENCQGDGLINCANCYECYDCLNCEQNRYCWDLTPSEKNVSSMDLTGGGIGELQYNCVGMGGGNYFMRMCLKCRLCSDCTYCSDCYHCKNCFGCSGLKKSEYCIFNKQYGKEEYELLVHKITEHMKQTKEWGNFFPLAMDRFAYNESKCMHYKPLTKDEVLQRGWKWRDPVEELLDVKKIVSTEKLPDNISDIPDDFLNWAIKCSFSKKPFRVIPQELDFYRKHGIPLPRLPPDIRMKRRRNLINPYRLWKRICAKCNKEVESSYAPEREETVYCEECYLKTVY